MTLLDDAPPDARYAHRVLGPLTDDDQVRGYLALRLLTAAGTGDRPVFKFAEDPGAGAWLAPQVAPVDWLRWLGLLAGGRVSATMTEPQARAEVISPRSRAFGAPGAIQAAITPFLTGARRILTLRRTHPAHPGDDYPGDVTIVIHPADVPDGAEPLLEAAGRAAAWTTLRVHFSYASGRTWDDLVDEADTWDDATTLYDTWDDAVAGTP